MVGVVPTLVKNINNAVVLVGCKFFIDPHLLLQISIIRSRSTHLEIHDACVQHSIEIKL